MQKTIYVMPNPYCALDANGLLAGGCQMAEERSGFAAPSNLKVGATLAVVDGTYNDREDEIAQAVNSGQMASPVIPAMYSRSKRRWTFSAAEPVAVAVSPITEGYYLSRARANGTPPCVFICSSSEDLPLAGLAAERARAIADYVAARGEEPPVAEWSKQFELDEAVADVMKAGEARRKADAAHEEKAAKDSADAADKAAAEAKGKRDAARKAAIERAKKSFEAPPATPGPGAGAPLLRGGAGGGAPAPSAAPPPHLPPTLSTSGDDPAQPRPGMPSDAPPMNPGDARDIAVAARATSPKNPSRSTEK